MVDSQHSNTRYCASVVILDYSMNNNLIEIFNDNNLPIFLLTHGYGSAKSTIYDILGYGGPKKTVALSIQTEEMSNFINNKIYKELELNKPGTGIVFNINLSSISNKLSKLCNEADRNIMMGSEEMVQSNDSYHLIITIVNSGHFDDVMKAAKNAGATGGTLIHARGLGSKDAERYLGITIQPEKDLVLILTHKEKKHAIMESILHEVGLNTAGRGICFSLPVNNALGLEEGLKKS